MAKSKIRSALEAATLCAVMGAFTMSANAGNEKQSVQSSTFKLPAPKLKGSMSVEETMLRRRSVRKFTPQSLALTEVSQILWAAQGITDTTRGFRTAPSAGALYPLEIYVVVANVDSLASGIYHYLPHGHELERIAEGDFRQSLADAALGQSAITDGAIILVFGAVYQRTAAKYGERAALYVPMEVGHAAENVCLQAVALNLGALTVGAFSEDRVREAMKMKEDETPLYILPVGKI